MNKEGVFHTHTGILLSHKKNKILPFAGLWMDLEDIMLIESVRQTQISLWYSLHVESKKIHQTSEYNKQRSKITDEENKLLM